MDFLTLEPNQPQPPDPEGGRSFYRWCQTGAHWYLVFKPAGAKGQNIKNSSLIAQHCPQHKAKFQIAHRKALREQMGRGPRGITTTDDPRKEVSRLIHDTLRMVPPRSHPVGGTPLKSAYEAGWPMACNECEHGCVPGSHVPDCTGCSCHG